MMKRILSALLVLAMTVSLVVVPAHAQDGAAMEQSGDVIIEGDNSFGTLLSNTVSQSQEGQQQNYDGQISDLVIEGTTATVEYVSPVAADVVVAVYTEDGSQMLGSGTVSAPAAEEKTLAEVRIEIPAMPGYFKAAAYLLNRQNHHPLSEEFRTDRYTKVMQDILDATVEDFDPNLVLNLDDDNTTNFAVFSENTLLSEEGSGVNVITGSGGVYTVTNADERFRSMQPGDSFAYTYPDGTVLIVNAESVQVDGTTVTVTENPDAELSDVFDFVKVEEDSYEKDYTYDGSTVDEGLTEISAEEVAQEQMSRAMDIGGAASIGKSFEIEKQLLGNDNSNANITGKITFGITVNLKIYLSLAYQKVEFSTDYFINGRIDCTGKAAYQLPLGKFDICLCAGVYAHVSPSFVVEVSGSIAYTLDWKKTEGRAYDSDSGRWTDISSPGSVSNKVEFEGTLFIGVQWEMGISVVSRKILDLSAVGRAGAEITMADTWQGVSTPSDSEIHPCAACLEGDIHAVVSLNLSMKIFNDTVNDGWNIGPLKIKICDCYLSVDYDDWGFSTCPHRAYKVTVQAVSPSGGPAKLAAVRLLPQTDGSVWTDTATVLNAEGKPIQAPIPNTDENGKTVFYLANGKYIFKAELDGVIAAKEGTVHNSEKSVDLVLDPAQQAFSLSEASVLLAVSDPSCVLSASYYGANVTKESAWSSSDPNVATVSNGQIQPVAMGSTVITASYTASGQTYTAQCEVTVCEDGPIQQGTCGDNVTWTLYEGSGTLVISGTGKMYDYVSEYASQGTKVPWAAYCKEITRVTVGNNVTSIGAYAFYGCKNLTGITLPDSLTSIGAYAFFGCDKLTGVNIPHSLTSIGEDAFSWCIGLTGITLPDSLTSIDKETFWHCTSLASITLPDSLTSIGEGAFSGCKSLASITIPGGITSIIDGTFAGCESLTSITIPDRVTSIGEDAFSGCSSLTSINIPDSVTSIDHYAFEECTSLTSITLPNSVTSIGYGIFNNCTSLTGITLPDSIPSINKGTFSGCTSLTGITLPDGITSIEEQAFYNCASLTGITIPDGVTSIGCSAFYNCSSLTNITIPDSVTSIGIWGFRGDGVFEGCTSLTSITIPERVTYIGWWTFYKCTSLTSITIPESVIFIGESAFSGCNSLLDVYYSGTITQWNSLTIGKYNEGLTSGAVTIHCRDGIIGNDEAEATLARLPSGETTEPAAEVTEAPTEPTVDVTEATTEEATEPTVEVTEVPTEEATEPTVEAATEAPTEETVKVAPLSNWQWSVLPQGARMKRSYTQLLSAGAGRNGVRTTALTGLEPGEEYVLVVSLVPGDLTPSGLLFIDQGNALEDGSISFHYIPRENAEKAVVQVYGGNTSWTEDMPEDPDKPTEHVHTEETIPGKSATCTETGLTEGKRCSTCGEILVKQETVSKKAHTVVVDKGKAATCTEKGLTEGKHCSVCKTVLTAQKEIAAKGHTVVIDKGKEPTATETGLTEGKHCSVCNTVLVKQEVIPAKGAEPEKPTVSTVPMYRLYNPYTQEHLLCSDEKEKQTLISIGWLLDGVAWNAPTEGEPVYRLYNPFDDWHTYSRSQEEIDSLTALGWTVDGAVTFSAPAEDGMIIYRLFNPYVQTNYHLLTASDAEKDLLLGAGWKMDGGAWYAAKP